MWDEPSCALYFGRLARIGRVICFDKRGTGVSDPVPLASLPTLEQWTDDALTALDAAQSRRTVVIGDTEGGLMAIMLAATFPDRISAPVLVNTFARWRRGPDYEIGMPDATTEKLLELYERHWGQDPEMLVLTAPSVGGEPPHAGNGSCESSGFAMPPGAATGMYRWLLNLDVRSILGPLFPCPRSSFSGARTDITGSRFGRYLAANIPGAQLIELPDADCFPFYTPQSSEGGCRKSTAFWRALRAGLTADRELATVLFTDVVGSTHIVCRDRGCCAGSKFRAVHDAIVRRNLQIFRGVEIERTGDGVLATFDGPARAVHCAVRIPETK